VSAALVELTDGLRELELVRSAARGDRRAFGELYARYARLVHGILLARVPPDEAEDLMQDVFLAAMKRLPALRDDGAFGGWLAAMARNRAIDYHRQRRPVEVDVEPRAPARPLEALDVWKVIQRLPEAYRETLVLRLVEGMTGPEIAERTGLTPDSVRVNLCRGMKLLREALGR